jgi:UDP-N-acetylmuramoyl-tripeptide--D-alanyl-D-alanine ligase
MVKKMFRLYEIAALLNGESKNLIEDQIIYDVCTDSRRIKKGDLFIALEGENFDGHDFVESAVKKGAVCAVIDKCKVDMYKDLKIPMIAVENTLKALGAAAKFHRDNYNLPVVAVTGSNGKTTTKDMIASVLSKKFNIIKTEGNFNNEIGLPLTLLRINQNIEAAVVEMAMRGLNQIRELSIIASPDIAVITNIGPVHYELLGSMENIAKAKSELLDELKSTGTAVINGDDYWCSNISGFFNGEKIFYGLDKRNDIRAENIRQKNFKTYFDLCYKRKKFSICLPLPGIHNVMNSLAAACVGIKMNVSFNDIIFALNSVKITSMRLEIKEGPTNTTIINDAYNANPISTIASLNILNKSGKGRKIAVLGDMLELGELAVKGHRKVGKEAAEKNLDYLITVGFLSKEIGTGALNNGMKKDKIIHVENADCAAEVLNNLLQEDDIVLIKGSRAIGLEKILLRL